MKKINIGIILMVITIIAFIVFVIIEDKTKKEDMERALEFIQEYYNNVYIKYAKLPEEYRDIESKMPEEEYNNYLNKLKTELSKYVLDEKLDMVYMYYKQRLDFQYRGKIMYKVYEITDIEYGNNEDNKIENGIIYAHIKYRCKLILDRRESTITDKDTERYIGTITRDFSDLYDFGALVMLQKLKNGDFKIVFDIAMSDWSA